MEADNNYSLHLLVVCAVFDIQSKCFHPPMCFRAVGAAGRWFQDAIKSGNKQDPLCTHPDDFQLLHLGSFDEVSGLITVLPVPELLMTGAACIS